MNRWERWNEVNKRKWTGCREGWSFVWLPCWWWRLEERLRGIAKETWRGLTKSYSRLIRLRIFEDIWLGWKVKTATTRGREDAVMTAIQGTILGLTSLSQNRWSYLVTLTSRSRNVSYVVGFFVGFINKASFVIENSSQGCVSLWGKSRIKE